MDRTLPPLVIIGGPTGVGKSDAAVTLAKKIGGEIISADSMQVYRGMDIGTAKLTKEEMDSVPHHMIDILEPTEPFNIARFTSMTTECIRQIHDRGHIPLLVGGTGFYIRAVLYGTQFKDEDDDPSIRLELEKTAKDEGG
ncbi:MAG: tRNA (adenosine(37)-N6)-dimethylallyltransferase MiaA, partial [Oscillospiraceae bacterium]|nr:tRNA (adenosine(37)-N6)-dimethylallyltransferase MiaA [Oscillospiraceae bacterium]